MERLFGLDLFSGIGGNSLALRQYVKTIAYCEANRYAQSVLLSRMGDGDLEIAPIWDDVQTLSGHQLDTVAIDIIIAGFPCQDISVAGHGKGLAGERSGLVFEIFRLLDEVKPKFVFLENVPAIRCRGGERVVKELASRGYDCRWDCLSAFDVGAPHKRDRWFLLGRRIDWADGTLYSDTNQDRNCAIAESEIIPQIESTIAGFCEDVANPDCAGQQKQWFTIPDGAEFAASQCGGDVPHTSCKYDQQNVGSLADTSGASREQERRDGPDNLGPAISNPYSTELWQQSWGCSRPHGKDTTPNPVQDGGPWWSAEPDVGRVVNGGPNRVDRIKCLGNAVVPAQAHEAFERLMGLKSGTGSGV